MLQMTDSGVFVPELGRFPGYVQGRRHQLGEVELSRRELDDYNGTLATVCPRARRVQADQIASIGRRLIDAAVHGRADPFVARSMAGVPRLVQMRSDRGWRLAEGLDGRIGAMLSYVDEPADLIPDAIPVIGQLDDALLVEMLLRDIAGEVTDYDDFCSYRGAIAARHRVDPTSVDVGFEDWLTARCAAHAARRPLWGAYLRQELGTAFHVC